MWDVILPVDFHIFQDGYCTTNQIGFYMVYIIHIPVLTTINHHYPLLSTIKPLLTTINHY